MRVLALLTSLIAATALAGAPDPLAMEKAAASLVFARGQSGETTWRFAIHQIPADAAAEAMLQDRLARYIATRQECPAGWEELSRRTSSGYLILEGRCKAPAPVR